MSVEGKPNPPERPKTGGPDRKHREDHWRKMDELKKGPAGLRCRILELEDLGRLYVEDVSGVAGGEPYWVQLPKDVKLLAEDPTRFDGRRKLKLEDLEIGQLLLITLRPGDGEILKVKVLPAPQEASP